MAKLNKLGKFAAAGFVACCGSYYLFQQSLSRNLINSQYCKDAMELVKNHNGAKHFLGEPIEPLKAKFDNYDSDKAKTTVRMFVSGPKSKGEVYLTIHKTSENMVEVASVQLQVGKDYSQRLEIKAHQVPSDS